MTSIVRSPEIDDRYQGNGVGAHPDREEGSVILSSCPVVQHKLSKLAKKVIAHRRSWWQGISILSGNLLAEIYGH